MTIRPISVVPNALSLLRLALACTFWLVPAPWRLAAVVVGGLSDALDGFIARRFGATSVLGGLLDAIADKLFTVSVLITLAAEGTIAWWQVALALARDVTVAALGAYAVCIRRFDAFRHMRPKLAGKTTTVAVFLWFIALLAPAPSPIVVALFVVAAVSSVGAAADYFVAFLRRPPELRGRGPRRGARDGR